MYKIILGSVRTDHGEIKEGNFIELSEKDAKLLMAEGVVEEVKEGEAKSKPKKKAKPKAKAKPKEKKAEEDTNFEPSLDWTRSELNEKAVSLGIKEPEKFISKKSLLSAILAGGEKK